MAEGVKIAAHAVKINGLWYRAGDVLPSEDQKSPSEAKEQTKQEETPVKPAPKRRTAKGRK